MTLAAANSGKAGQVVLAMPVFKLKLARKENRRITSQNRIPESLGEDAEIYQALVVGTRDYVIKNGFKKVVLRIERRH
jgi:NAD+ synthase (glutamine-hydrolysing)